MATEECAICGESVPFATTTHVLVNPKHEEGVADHYVCRPCYDEHLGGLFAALEADDEETAAPREDDLSVNVVEEKDQKNVEANDQGTAERAPLVGEDGDERIDPGSPD